MRRCKAEVERTRQRLLEAAERVFSDRGYAVARLEDIADVAGLTRGSIYWHFQGKPDLLDAVIDRTWFSGAAAHARSHFAARAPATGWTRFFSTAARAGFAGYPGRARRPSPGCSAPAANVHCRPAVGPICNGVSNATLHWSSNRRARATLPVATAMPRPG